MAARPTDLPDYERPPLVEVALAVQFAELQGYRTVHAGLLWGEKFREAYPHFVEQPPLDPMFEVFGPVARAAQFQIKQMPGPPVPRLWFMNNQQTELVQIQANRFVRNWRKVGEGANYPRYEKLRECFFAELEEINAFFKAWEIGEIQPNQCEITYVNRLELEGHDLRIQPGAALELFSRDGLRPDRGVGSLPEPEDCNLSARYIIRDTDGKPCGRLLVVLQLWSNEPALRLDLTVRGAPATADLGAVANFFDEGRRTIVQAFTAITTKQMHKRWRRVQ
jgi:uncharacterized protein (TIGR04255 family)